MQQENGNTQLFKVDLEKDYDVMEKLSWKECKEVIEKINEK